MWKQWVNAILASQLLQSVHGLTAAALSWTLVVAGAVIAILGVWSAIEEQSPEYHRRQLQHG